jgi:hypothetical protein
LALTNCSTLKGKQKLTQNGMNTVGVTLASNVFKM